MTYAKVIKGQEIFASNDVNDEDGGPYIKDLFGVVGYSSAEDGTGKDTKSPNKLKHLTKEEADKRVEGYKITADTFVSEPYALNTLNNVSSQADFATIQDYKPEYKQAYKITPELAKDLLGMDDLSFPAGKIKMPFRTVYFDLSDLRMTSTGDGISNTAHAFIEGIFLTYGKVPFEGEEAGFAGFVVLTGVPETKELLFGGVSFAVDDADDSQTLNDLIEANAGMPEIKQALRTALLLAAYISSEKPDITENEVQKTFYRPSGKLKTSAVRKWDIGVRYATEVRRRLTESSDTNRPHSTGKSPRPHIRKAHWHIYRIGPGRKETKVLWLAPIEVNCRIGKEKAEAPAVVRIIK